MNIGRLSGAQGTEDTATHMRIAEYVRVLCERYPAVGFTPHQEWLVEQTMEALTALLEDVRCSSEERRAVKEFLALATEVLPGSP